MDIRDVMAFILLKLYNFKQFLYLNYCKLNIIKPYYNYKKFVQMNIKLI